MEDSNISAAQDVTPSGTETDATGAAGSDAPAAKPDLPFLNDQDSQAAKPEGDGKSPAAQPGEPGKDGAPPTAFTPESYNVSLPEGLEANTELLGEFKALAVQHKIPPEAARKILDLQVKNVTANMDRFAATVQAWRAEIAADPEFGGNNMEMTRNDAHAALEEFDTSKTLIKELTAGGYGSHPGIVRFLARVGRHLRTEGKVYTDREQKTDAKPLRDDLWPDETMPI